MLDQDVCALLAAGPASIGQRGQAPGVPAPHVHPVLQKKARLARLAGHGGKGVGSQGEKGEAALRGLG